MTGVKSFKRRHLLPRRNWRVWGQPGGPGRGAVCEVEGPGEPGGGGRSQASKALVESSEFTLRAVGSRWKAVNRGGA